MTEHRVYQTGGHTFTLDFPKEYLSEKELRPYAPFRTDSYQEEPVLFTLTLLEDSETLVTDGVVTADFTDENGKVTISTTPDGEMMVSMSVPSGAECCRLRISKNYSEAKAWIGGKAGERCYALDTALMLLYAFASSKYDTLLLHASAMEYEDTGYLFLGRSGTGKSTHSSLWFKHIGGCSLLNDDNPVVRIEDGKVWLYGSPWSGKTPCYRNRRVPLGGVVRLYQASANRIAPVEGIKAYAALSPSCSCMRWNGEMAEAVHATLCRVIDMIPVYSLACRPDREAARLCFNTLTGTYV